MIKKMITDGFMEQDIPGECPECRYDMIFEDKNHYVIGYGEYPIGGYRNSMKPGSSHCLVYECPRCFVKSVHHMELDSILKYIKDIEFIDNNK